MISPKNDKAIKIMIKTQILSWKTKEVNRRLRVRPVWFYSELAPTDSWCNLLQTLLGRKKYEEAMSDEHPRTIKHGVGSSKAISFWG